MRLIVLFFSFTAALNSYACSEAMKPYDFECKAQDRYKKLEESFLSSKTTPEQIKGFVLPRALGNANYFSAKNDLLNKTEPTLIQNKNWLAWTNGKKFFDKYTPVFLELNDILKLHKIMFKESQESGKLRTSYGETNPVIHYNCNDSVINDSLTALFENYDVKSSEGYPLITLENLSPCEDKKSYSADLVFYKGASVKTELKSWLMDFNETLNNYTAENEKKLNPPYQQLSDLKRNFLAIHPFLSGNEMLINVLMDYASKKMDLPPMSLTTTSAILMNREDNRSEIHKATHESLNFLETCLYETKVNFVSPQCRSLGK